MLRRTFRIPVNALMAVVALSCSDSTSPKPGGGTLARIAGGDQQVGPVAQALAVPLTVEITDSHGNPAPSVRITFSVTSGGGSLSTADTISDSNGVATTQWTLGPSVAATQRVVAWMVLDSTDSTQVGMFNATALPGPAQLAAVRGSGQTAAPGAVLGDSLLGRVADQYGNPIAGAHVTWTVSLGGGSVSPGTGTSNAQGYVSTQWTLGSASGGNAATATLANFAPVTFVATGTSVTPDVAVQIVSPTDTAFIGDTLSVGAVVTSKYQVAAVTATVGSQQLPLTYSASRQQWVAAIPMSGVSFGPVQLLVTATDIHGATGIAAISIKHDDPPRLTVDAPTLYAVASPSIAIHATCTDLDASGCTKLTASVNGAVLASGVALLDATVSLAAYSGPIVMRFQATDAVGQTSVIDRRVVVSSIQHANLITSVPGAVQDVNGNRVLFVDSTVDALELRTIGGSDAIIYQKPGIVVGHAYLTPSGAVFLKGAVGSLALTVTEFRNGQITDLSTAGSEQGLVVKNGFAVWESGVGHGPLTLRDLTAGVSTTVASDAGNWMYDVSTAGDVAYWNSSYQVVLVPYGGTPLQVTHDPTLWNTYTLTDGSRVVYRKGTPCCVMNQSYQIAIWSSAGGEIALTSPSTREPLPGSDYQIENGWVAFTKEAAGTVQVWTYSPAGVTTQVSTLGSSSRIDALGSSGEVVFENSGQRYLSKPPYTTATSLGNAVGKVLWRDGHFVVLIVGSVYQVQ